MDIVSSILEGHMQCSSPRRNSKATYVAKTSSLLSDGVILADEQARNTSVLLSTLDFRVHDDDYRHTRSVAGTVRVRRLDGQVATDRWRRRSPWVIPRLVTIPGARVVTLRLVVLGVFWGAWAILWC
jgi:hypothetical protein